MEMYNGFYKAKFKGLFTPLKSKNDTGKLSFSEIKWHLLHLDQITKIPAFNLFENKCDDFLFHAQIKAKKRNWFDNEAQIIFEGKLAPINGGLNNVLIKNVSYPKGLHQMHVRSFSKNVIEMHGDIYFQLSVKTIPKSNLQNRNSKVEFKSPFLVFDKLNLAPDNIQIVTENLSQNNNRDTEIGYLSESKRNRLNIHPFFIYLITLILSLFFFYEFRYIIALIGIPLLFSSLFKGSKFLSRLVFALVFVFLLLFAYFSIYPKKHEEAVETKDGNIKVSPPVKVNDTENGTDQKSKKEITWYDFISNKYDLSYNTSNNDYIKTKEVNENYISQLAVGSSNEAFENIYRFYSSEDVSKLDSLIQTYKSLALEKNLNAFQTAEMVCTFIQEIPYCLVHQNNCQDFLRESGSAFVVDYHREGKPCLPDIPAGVQSPFEFIHNLKGDCDTRTLYAYTILKSFKIPCSIWVSEVYGHSILGVGLPNSNGFYKEVFGKRHYGIELTAKGYRIGMIAGEQRNPKNWQIALTYNN